MNYYVTAFKNDDLDFENPFIGFDTNDVAHAMDTAKRVAYEHRADSYAVVSFDPDSTTRIEIEYQYDEREQRVVERWEVWNIVR